MSENHRKVSVTILVDNHAPPGRGLAAEHGFSALIERDDARVLFDTGQGLALPANARALGKDLYKLDAVALSHGHYDHTGGLLHVLRLNGGIRVIAHPQALGSHFVKRAEEAAPREIGIPHEKSAMTDTGARFHLTDRFEEILPGIHFTGYVPRTFSGVEDDRLLASHGSGFAPDTLPDDASLVLETVSGPVLLLGCAHAGVRNILEHVCSTIGYDRVHAVIGGTHLAFSPPSEISAVIEAFERRCVELVATAHCTGDGPNEILRDHFGPRFRHAEVGATFNFG